MEFDLEQYVLQRLRRERRDRILGWTYVILTVLVTAMLLFEDPIKARYPSLCKPLVTLPWHHK